MFSASPSTPAVRPAARPVARLFLLALVLLAAGLSPAPIRRAAAAPAQSPVSAAGFLTGPAAGDPLAIALAYIRAHRAGLGLSEDDLADFVVKDRYTSPNNGVTHIYLRQRLDGIEVYGADINVNVARDGRIVNLGNRFVANLRQAANAATPAPASAGPSAATYSAYALPSRNPFSGPRAAPTNPADPQASPYGWHDTNGAAGAEYTTTQGNNAFAYADLMAPDGFGAGDAPPT
jgi:hypothetical protein